jgi:hypothetical protein
VKSREVCIALLFVGIDSKDLEWPWWQLGRIRVERDLALYELLNEDVGNLCGWPIFGNNSCVSLHLFSTACVHVLRALLL